MAAGGDAISRDADGRVVFVEGAIAGETVDVRLTETRRDFARGRVAEVVSPSPWRVDPPCPGVVAGCGGCQWQHVAASEQPSLKAAIVADALRRIARLRDDDLLPLISTGIAPEGYRTTVRLGVDGQGRAAYRLRHSHDLLAPTTCLVTHPGLEELIVDGRFPGAREVMARLSVSTGARLVVVSPRAGQVEVPSDVVVVGDDELRRGRAVSTDELVAGRSWRVSAQSFFQSGPAAAELLAQTVDDAVGDAAGEGDLVVDAYAGVGLLGGVVAARRGARLVAVESSPSAVSDARANLADLDATVVRSAVDRWRPGRSRPAVVIADPPRSGLGGQAVAKLGALGADRLVLVACDPASLARDARLLVDEGYKLVSVDVVDLFPHTFHVEAVGRFDRMVRSSGDPVPSAP